MTRAEHVQWCKDRAMQYVNEGDLQNAVLSMMSDLEKHEETGLNNRGGALAMLGLLAMQQAQSGDRDAVVRYITGFN
jgi:hypothetical protein